MVVGGREISEGGISKGHEEILGGDGYVCYLDCGGGFRDHLSKLIKLYTVNTYSLQYISHTSMNLFAFLS